MGPPFLFAETIGTIIIFFKLFPIYLDNSPPLLNRKRSSRSANPSLHGHTHYFPFSALHFISPHSERASVRKEPFSDQLGLGLKIFLDGSSNDEYTKDESTKPD
jgi:hypothetical protein